MVPTLAPYQVPPPQEGDMDMAGGVGPDEDEDCPTAESDLVQVHTLDLTVTPIITPRDGGFPLLLVALPLQDQETAPHPHTWAHHPQVTGRGLTGAGSTEKGAFGVMEAPEGVASCPCEEEGVASLHGREEVCNRCTL